MIVSYILIIFVGGFVLYVASKTKSNDTEIIIGQKREIREISERIQEVLDAEKIEKKLDRQLKSVVSEASKLFKSNEYKQAEKKYLSIIKEDAKNIKAYQGLGLIYLEEEEFEGAAEVFQKICELDPTNDIAFNNLGMCYFNLKKFDEAIKAYESSVALNPHVSHRYANLALAASKNKNYKVQIKALESAISLEPKIEYMEELAVAAKSAGDKQLLIKTLEKIIEKDPKNADAQRKLARFKK